jgi:hypothetical protein
MALIQPAPGQVYVSEEDRALGHKLRYALRAAGLSCGEALDKEDIEVFGLLVARYGLGLQGAARQQALLFCLMLWEEAWEIGGDTFVTVDRVPRIDLTMANVSDSFAWGRLRVKKRHWDLVCNTMGIPDQLRLPDGSWVPGRWAFMVLRCKLANPCTNTDLVRIFGTDDPLISRAATTMSLHILRTKGQLLTNGFQRWLPYFTEFNEAIKRTFEARRPVYHPQAPALPAALNNVIGFLDPTDLPVSKPTHDQHEHYNRYPHRQHKQRAVCALLPNGMFAFSESGIRGRENDAGAQYISNVNAHLAASQAGQRAQGFLLGDKRTVSESHIIAMKSHPMTLYEAYCNAVVSLARFIGAEQPFGKLKTLWTSLNDKHWVQTEKNNWSNFFDVSVLMTNQHTQLYQNTSGTCFGLRAPDLEANGLC